MNTHRRQEDNGDVSEVFVFTNLLGLCRGPIISSRRFSKVFPTHNVERIDKDSVDMRALLLIGHL